jgi:hypothetical protein
MTPQTGEGEHILRLTQDLTATPAAETTNRAALVKRIAAALTEHDLVHLTDPDLADEYDCCAEAVFDALVGGSRVATEAQQPGCPTPCDANCPYACHEIHHPAHRRTHEPWTCPGAGEPQKPDTPRGEPRAADD